LRMKSCRVFKNLNKIEWLVLQRESPGGCRLFCWEG
jgi:hypothetical protein